MEEIKKEPWGLKNTIFTIIFITSIVGYTIYYFVDMFSVKNNYNSDPCINTSKQKYTVVDGEVISADTIYGCEKRDGTFYEEPVDYRS